MDTVTLWLLFFAVGLGTFLVRVSFIELHGATRELLDRSKDILMLLAACDSGGTLYPGDSVYPSRDRIPAGYCPGDGRAGVYTDRQVQPQRILAGGRRDDLPVAAALVAVTR